MVTYMLKLSLNRIIVLRVGNDIYLQIPISFVDAALGVTLEVPTVYGNVEVKIPAGTQPGATLRLAAKGC